MKKVIYFALLIAVTSCNSSQTKTSVDLVKQVELTNTKIKSHAFLDCMYKDSYFPEFLVDKCKNILLRLCQKIETSSPKNLEELYQLTHSSTNELNELEDEFFENDSEIETGARECFASNFDFIATAYGFEADLEELIATRNW